MEFQGEITATYENGVLRPDHALSVPEHTRLRLSIRRVEVTPESSARAKEAFKRIRRSGRIRLEGWRPTRDEMHERD